MRDGVFKHFLHFIDALFNAEAFGVFDIPFPQSIAKFRMFYHMIDLSGKCIDIARSIKIILRQRKVLCGGHLAVCNEGHQPAGDRLYARDRLDFRIRRVHIEIAEVDHVHEFFFGKKGDDGRFFYFFFLIAAISF